MSDKKYLPVIRDNRMLKAFLCHLQKLDTKIAGLLYIGSIFIIHCGLSLDDLLSITVNDVKGRSFLYRKKGRLFLYSDDFSEYLDSYIRSLPCDCELLFMANPNETGKRISNSYFSMGIHRAFGKFNYDDHTYDGNYTTLVRTYMYHFVINYGSYDSYTIRDEKLYSSRLSAMSTLSKDEYKNLMVSYLDNDFLAVLKNHSDRLFEELDYYVLKYPDCTPLKQKISNLYKALFDLSDCMDIPVRK